MIYADPPRKYTKNGYSWSHVSSPDLSALEHYARAWGLKRKDRTPFIHYDVTAQELQELLEISNITMVSRREFLRIMKQFKQPRKRKR